MPRRNSKRRGPPKSKHARRKRLRSPRTSAKAKTGEANPGEVPSYAVN